MKADESHGEPIRTGPSSGAKVVLDPGAIHLWLTYYDQIDDEKLLAKYRELLSTDEKAQELRFYFARDRLRYLVTRALVRTVLSRYLPILPAEWAFAAGSYGRPEIANIGAREAGVEFNISHTHSLIVLGVTQGRALGVDVENFAARNISIDIADRFFAPVETLALATVPPDLQQFRFFEYWTFKESYIKARGMGLSLPLDRFSFHFPQERSVTMEIEPELGDSPERWQFWQLRPGGDYLVAVCAERLNTQRSSLLVREIVPMTSEKTLATALIRTSE
jgi:4'-phosphopantetheinyl transferase